ncbi:sulfite exporter TauE/SafE family protein [Fontivita pretiosa]|jgi:sulfite exporter TauE/SafE|uniref:sulfite exporter TauE/SafE family protein n=1 Tax=Fontivita pretiosa TaxID=2989684 RepID=UPI003D1651B3
MIALIVTIFLASLVGSLHCVGMCGAFVALAVGDSRGWQTTAAYHGGRLASYVALGALAGAAGQLLDIAGALAGARPLAAGLAGATMVLVGVVVLLRWLGVRVAAPALPQSWTRLIARASGAAIHRPPVLRAAVIGLCTTLLPCGWLYAFAITAAGTAHPLSGAATMAFFWLGTVPALLVVGLGVRRLLGPLASRAPAIASILLVVVGLYTLIGRSMMDPVTVARNASSHATAHAPPACCAQEHDR